MEAAEFLKNVVYINLQLTDDEKVCIIKKKKSSIKTLLDYVISRKVCVSLSHLFNDEYDIWKNIKL